MKLWKSLKNRMLTNQSQIVCEEEAEMTFEEMVIFAEQFAQKLKGIKCCAIICQSEMAASVALLSCFAAEVTAVPLSKRYGDLHCKKISWAMGGEHIKANLERKKFADAVVCWQE